MVPQKGSFASPKIRRRSALDALDYRMKEDSKAVPIAYKQDMCLMEEYFEDCTPIL